MKTVRQIQVEYLEALTDNGTVEIDEATELLSQEFNIQIEEAVEIVKEWNKPKEVFGGTKMKTWIMKDGTEIAIEDMTNGHIVSSIEMLKRNAFKLKLKHELQSLANLGSWGNDKAEEEFNKLLEMSDEDYIKINENYIDLTEELERRIK